MTPDRLRLVFVSQGNIPSRWAHTFQAMKMAEAFAGEVADFELLTQRSTPAERPAIDLRSWYGVRRPFRVTELAGQPTEDDGTFPGVWYPGFDIAAAMYCARKTPDLVFTRSPNAARLCVESGLPTVVESHMATGDREFRHLLDVAREPHLLAVVTITVELETRYVASGISADRIEVHPDAVDVEAFRVDGDRDALRAALDIDPRAHVATYCGHLYDGRGVEAILDCAFRLPDVLFLLVGGWERDIERRRREAAGLDNVEIRGFVPNGRVPGILAQSDVLLLPYSTSCATAEWMSPLKLFESMAAARPIVATRLPALARHLRHGENALLVEPDSGAALAAAISELRESPERARAMARAAASDVETHTWSRRARRVLEAACAGLQRR